jgi:endonuclease III
MISKGNLIKIAKILDEKYPFTTLHNRTDPLEECIFILLTSQTDEDKYLETWNSFISSFPSMDIAANATEEDIFNSIKSGGLGKWKAKRIKKLLKQVKEVNGEYSLASWENLNNSQLEKNLLKLDGIGIKSARCVMMYSFNRNVFPVDTHVKTVLTRIGFNIPKESERSKKFADRIQNNIPPNIQYRFHVNLIQLGRSFCKKRSPRCEECIINQICYFGKKGHFA